MSAKMMKIIFTKNFQELSRKAAEIILKEIKKKPDLLICAATGASPSGAYKLLAEYRQKHKNFFEKVRIIKLDEWGGLELDDPATCESYIRKHIINPLGIAKGKYFSFDSDPPDLKDECKKIKAILEKEGPIDLCILGLGVDGHLGLNEPADKMELHAHANKLKSTTLRHRMLEAARGKAKYGLTLGMRDILSSRKIILIATGEGKKEIFASMLKGRVRPKLPATFLRTHKKAICLSDLNPDHY